MDYTLGFTHLIVLCILKRLGRELKKCHNMCLKAKEDE